MAVVCGIDEAGRGPVIGPLVICGVLANPEDELYLNTLGVTDSKLLTPQKRARLFGDLKKTLKHKVIIIEPAEIDAALRNPDTNLNLLEADKSGEIINVLKPDTALLDCPSNNIAAYIAEMRKRVKDTKIKIIAEHKADLNHVAVGAASIIAKVTRDNAIEALKEKIGINFGSGYPSDPLTQAFVKKHYKDYPDLFRKEWASYKDVAEGKKQRKIGDF